LPEEAKNLLLQLLSRFFIFVRQYFLRGNFGPSRSNQQGS